MTQPDEDSLYTIANGANGDAYLGSGLLSVLGSGDGEFGSSKYEPLPHSSPYDHINAQPLNPEGGCSKLDDSEISRA